MRMKSSTHFGVLILAASIGSSSAIDRFVSLTGGHVPPFTSWTDAATNIQDAIEAASAGDVVWVTNGVYATGGKVMAGDLTNRVVIDKALTVQSVNGWAVTTIEGARDFVNVSATAVRGVWMTNGAVLRGFTVRDGQSRSVGDADTLRSGGGVWCSTTNATIVDSVIRENASAQAGGGCYRGRLENCLVLGNQSFNGGGVFGSTVVNSAIVSNSASSSGGGAYQSALTNCTVTFNSASMNGGGTASSLTYNSIIWSNSSAAPIIVIVPSAPPAYCCLQVPMAGSGNISLDPQLRADGIHVAATSPCRNVGNTTFVSGTDFDLQPWSGAPSIGCDEWRAEPISGKPTVTPAHPGGICFSAYSVGQEPLAHWWLRDGMVLTNNSRIAGANSATLLVSKLTPEDAGGYQTVVSNAVGVNTGLVAQLVVRFVNASSPSPTAPHTNWATAAVSIQEAIDASLSGDVILATNGVYASGGKVMSGDLTNRIALTRALTVMSVNGPSATFIEGLKDPTTTNGPAAVRPAWLTAGAWLDGFTIRNGGTRSTGDQTHLRSGGGVWASGTNTMIANCILVSNAAHFAGGAFRGWLDRSTISGNFAQTDGGGGCSNLMTSCLIEANRAGANAGGLKDGWVFNSAITRNTAATGGGLYGMRARNCTVTFNKATLGVGGVYWTPSATLTNLIVWSNTGGNAPNYNLGPFYNSCSLPLPSGSGNISSDPLLLDDGFHIATNSPCQSAGITPGVGTDIDGQNWTNPPSMGCDQWGPEAVVTGARLVLDTWGAVRVTATAIGNGPFEFRWLKDGALLTDAANLSGTSTTNLIIRPIGPNDVAGYQLIVSNALGVVTSTVARLSLRFVDLNSTSALPPYTNWSGAAMSIQEAIDVAEPGDLILVANGIYARGGKVMSGSLTNRVALDKPVTVMSMNGPSATIIQGEWDFANTNGPGAVRCVWLADGAALVGLTLRGGAGVFGNPVGGVWCNSTNARVANCIIEACYNGATSGTLVNCLVRDNFAQSSGAATAFSSLINCTVTGNRVLSPGVSSVCLAWTTNTIFNSIIWGNKNSANADANYGTGGPGTVSYSCIRPLPTGTNNISLDPLLAADGTHLLAGSPCTGAGNPAFASGVDIDNQPWANPPSMGCDEPRPELVAGQPQWTTAKGAVRIAANYIGQLPVAAWWYRNGTLATDDTRHSGANTTEFAIKAFDPTDNGLYHVVVSNSFGSVTSTWTQIRARFVNVANATPVTPFTNWTMAATSIQDAIEIADHGDLVVVSNGVYAVGGKAIASDLTNRVALDKAVTVTSVNGAEFTIVQGAWDAATNGPAAERCAWVGNWATLSGFTLHGGATRSSGDINTLQSGGGVWGLSQNAFARDCIISNNAALQSGGGVFGGALFNCTVANNRATDGGGAYRADLTQCIVRGNLGYRYGGGINSCQARSTLIQANQAVLQGGGVLGSRLDNCTIVENLGLGVSIGYDLRNCIIWGNSPRDVGDGSATLNFSCSTPVFNGNIPGTNNIIADPQLVDPFHLAATSPCRDTGSPLYAIGHDLDDEPWQNPPSMGADQFTSAPRTGELTVSIEALTNVLVNRPLPLVGRIGGLASRIEWNFGDGPTFTNLSYTITHA